jgi:magnesium-transporting ATPase (P-type)
MFGVHSVVLPPRVLALLRDAARPSSPSHTLLDAATADADAVLERLSTRRTGLSGDDALARYQQHGPNVLAREHYASGLRLLSHAILNPLVLVLAALASVSFATGDARAGLMMPMDHAHIDELKREYEQLSTEGFRVLAIATKDVEPRGVVAGDPTPVLESRSSRAGLQGP